MKFHSPSVLAGDGHAPTNTLGIRHLAFRVDDVDAAPPPCEPAAVSSFMAAIPALPGGAMTGLSRRRSRVESRRSRPVSKPNLDHEQATCCPLGASASHHLEPDVVLG